MTKQNALILGIVLLIGIISINFICAELNLSDSLTSQRYQLILNEFNKTDLVPVIVEVYSSEKVDTLISSFSEINFKNVKKELPPTIFTVEVTKKGLDELANNSNTKAINLQESLSPVSTPSEKKSGLGYGISVILLILIISFFIYKIKKKK
jgi:hypothetical protein